MDVPNNGRIENVALQTTFYEEWSSLLGDNATLDHLEKCCFSGRLRDSRVRSIVWRILLKVLPLDRLEWVDILKQNRAWYAQVKHHSMTNPREEIFNMDPELNNPLSLQSENPWQQYFADVDLRDCINKDVERTFPELAFFQSEKTRSIMSDILFVHSKINSHVSYRQGMHEILAPVLFVVYFDHQAYAHLREQGALRGLPEQELRILQTVNDPRYLEHDAFSLFRQLMILIEKWYVNNDEDDSSAPIRNPLGGTPFSKNDYAHVNSDLLRKLDFIHHELLQHFDPPLYRHLAALEISPQVYGIRWLRLLFGREFPMHDLLFLWDSILADRPSLVLVDHIFVALLVQIRHLLLSSDYSGCLQYLMRYPPTADVHQFLQLALHLKSPKKHPKPVNCALGQYSHITLAGKAHPNTERDFPPKVMSRKNSRQHNKQIDAVLNNIGRQALSAHSTPLIRRKYPESTQLPNSTFYTQSSWDNRDEEANGALHEIELMKEQVALLQSRLNDVDRLAQLAARRLNNCIDDISVLAVRNPFEEERKAAILKELRSIDNQLTRNTVSEQWIRSVPLQHDSGQPHIDDGVELATEASSGTSPAVARSRVSSRSLRAENELIELHFDRKKNF